MWTAAYNYGNEHEQFLKKASWIYTKLNANEVEIVSYKL